MSVAVNAYAAALACIIFLQACGNRPILIEVAPSASQHVVVSKRNTCRPIVFLLTNKSPHSCLMDVADKSCGAIAVELSTAVLLPGGTTPVSIRAGVPHTGADNGWVTVNVTDPETVETRQITLTYHIERMWVSRLEVQPPMAYLSNNELRKPREILVSLNVSSSTAPVLVSVSEGQDMLEVVVLSPWIRSSPLCYSTILRVVVPVIDSPSTSRCIDIEVTCGGEALNGTLELVQSKTEARQ